MLFLNGALSGDLNLPYGNSKWFKIKKKTTHTLLSLWSFDIFWHFKNSQYKYWLVFQSDINYSVINAFMVLILLASFTKRRDSQALWSLVDCSQLETEINEITESMWRADF